MYCTVIRMQPMAPSEQTTKQRKSTKRCTVTQAALYSQCVLSVCVRKYWDLINNSLNFIPLSGLMLMRTLQDYIKPPPSILFPPIHSHEGGWGDDHSISSAVTDNSTLPSNLTDYCGYIANHWQENYIKKENIVVKTQHRNMWQSKGYVTSTDALVPNRCQKTFWKHDSTYFSHSM